MASAGESFVAALREAGYRRTAIIGRVLPQGDQLEPIRLLV